VATKIVSTVASSIKKSFCRRARSRPSTGRPEEGSWSWNSLGGGIDWTTRPTRIYVELCNFRPEPNAGRGSASPMFTPSTIATMPVTEVAGAESPT
jgi:hypothetical protein